jgi:hypothetical protein
MAHDGPVLEQSAHISLAELRDQGGFEVTEGAPEGASLAQDGDPGQAALEAFQADPLEHQPVISHWSAPLVVMVGKVLVRGMGPGAARVRTLAFCSNCHDGNGIAPPSASR